jgi:hypothetical protein
MEESSTTLVVGDLACSFDFRGLRCLMQLRRLATFVIHRNTFLFQCTRYSSDKGYHETEMHAFESPVS